LVWVKFDICRHKSFKKLHSCKKVMGPYFYISVKRRISDKSVPVSIYLGRSIEEVVKNLKEIRNIEINERELALKVLRKIDDVVEKLRGELLSKKISKEIYEHNIKKLEKIRKEYEKFLKG